MLVGFAFKLSELHGEGLVSYQKEFGPSGVLFEV